MADTDKFLFSKCVEIAQVEVDNQSVIINGVMQKAVTTVVHCPSCGRILYDFGLGFDLISATNTVSENREKLQNLFAYCPQCGQKLSFPEIIVLEGDKPNEN